VQLLPQRHGGGEDNRPNSIGMHDARGPPTVWDSAFQGVQFWDRRAPSLEEQAKGPVVNPIEMGMSSLAEAMARLREIPEYATLFQAAFPNEKEPVTADNAANAVAAYGRALITLNSPYDRYVKGDKGALTEQQVRRMNTFAAVGCVACHSGPTFNGPQVPGQGFFMKFPTFQGSPYDALYHLTADNGRFEATKAPADRRLRRVPTLRNVALTAPYFHNGQVATLDEAVRVMAKTQLNKTLSPEQVADIAAFLNGLSGEFPQQQLPRLPGTPGFSVIPPVDPHMKKKGSHA
jgi:cytochrome c peroxidase